MKQVLFFASMIPAFLYGQSDIEGLLVEKYYVTDANDATDMDGGGIGEGLTTYRVFLDLAPGARLRSIFANADHQVFITSSELIWNNSDRGKPFGYQIDDARLDENTVALDSWLSLGRSSDVHWSVPKDLDSDGSVIGGTNNDGGSAGIAGGLLINYTDDMGYALTDRDGLAVAETVLPDVVVVGDNPATVLDDETLASAFVTNNMTMQLAEGTSGPSEENFVVIAQLTTHGELAFQFNVEVINADGEVVKYVADATNLQPDETVSAFLKYPPTCGCTDPDYVEYDPAAGCDDGSCATLVVIGCADTLACNYDPAVNLNVQELCCILPDNCEGLDPELICDEVSISEYIGNDDVFSLFPNPTEGEVNLQALRSITGAINIEVVDLMGRVVDRYHLAGLNEGEIRTVSFSAGERGIYMVRITASGETYDYRLIRN